MNILEIRSWLQKERDFVTALTTTATENIASVADVTGMVLLPLIPATLTALSVYFSVLEWESWPGWSATLLGVLVAGGLESLGIAAAKTAMRLYRAWRDKLSLRGEFLTVSLTTLLYASLVILIIYFGHGLPDGLRWIGYVSPILAVSMYVVVGFNADLQERRDRDLEARLFERDLDNELAIAHLQDKKERLGLRRDQEMLAYKQKLELKKLRDEAKIKNAGSKLAMTPLQRKVEARRLLKENPNMSGAELGRYFGLGARSGELIKKEIVDGRTSD